MDTQPNVGTDLVRIHKVITRALNVSLQHVQESNIAEKHRSGFSSYVRALAILLHAHHLGEDELAFPFWKIRFPSGPYDELTQQHRQMVIHLERIERWVQAGDEAWQTNALGELQDACSDLRSIWEVHIALEEDALGPENSRKYLSSSENESLGKQLSEHGQAHSQPGELVMPFIVYNLSGPEREEFVKLLPPVVSGQLIPVAWKAAWEPMLPFLAE
jgi:hypothetical protein